MWSLLQNDDYNKFNSVSIFKTKEELAPAPNISCPPPISKEKKEPEYLPGERLLINLEKQKKKTKQKKKKKINIDKISESLSRVLAF